jgi:hypothetical protein
MDEYLDPTRGLDQLRTLLPQLSKSTPQFDAPAVRAALLASEPDAGRIIPYAYRPMDTRWVYWTNRARLLDRRRDKLVESSYSGQVYLVSRPKAERSREGLPFSVVSEVCDHHFIRPNGAAFPWLQSRDHSASLFEPTAPHANVSERATRYLEAVHAPEASHLLMPHAVAVMSAPAYLEGNADGVAAGWPRIPLPGDAGLLRKSAAIGKLVIGLLDPSAGDSNLGATLRLGTLSAVAGRSLDPALDLSVTAHWGIAGRGGICMPSTGTLVEREYTDAERDAIAEGAVPLGLKADQVRKLLGDACFDVYLNDVAYWRCVPGTVWKYTIGGYQVIKKWLSYRERALLGRDLTTDEARYVTEMVRRIAALVLLQPELDANYERVKADVWKWEA